MQSTTVKRRRSGGRPSSARSYDGDLRPDKSSTVDSALLMTSANDPLQWGELIVERGAAPIILEDAAFRHWMSGRRIFVSSVMDDEMTPARSAVRAWLTQWGAVPVMWEAITPRDQSAEGAYLDGVESSDLFLLLLGSRYGVPDATGYSPTHKEANRARERGIPRLLFVLAHASDASRAGRLNDWLRELFTEVAGSRYADAIELCAQLEARLREFAAQQESLWLKLGPLVFPGRVTTQRGAGGAAFEVTARVRDGAVRRGLSGLTGLGSRLRADRLSWVDQTEPVVVEQVRMDTARTSESSLSVICRQASDRGNSIRALGGIQFSAHGRTYAPHDQAELWARAAVFGEQPTDSARRRGWEMTSLITAHEGPALPEVLASLGASSWLAEGLTRLFLVEHLHSRYAGHFDRLDVGPATARGVPIDARFSTDSGLATVRGVVPLR